MFGLLYRFRMKFNISDTHILWKGSLTGSLSPKINIHSLVYMKKTDSPKLSTLKNFHFRFNTNSGGFFSDAITFFIFKTTS
jgi:hypothetical protein